MPGPEEPGTVPSSTRPRGTWVEPDPLPLVHVLNVLLRHRRLIILLPLLFAVIGVGIAVVRPREYVASASFVPQSDAVNMSEAAALARQFGIGSGGLEGSGYSPDFYAELLQQRDLLRATLSTTYRVPQDDEVIEATLIDLYEIDHDSPARMWKEAEKKIGREMEVSVSSQTGIVRVSMATFHPELSEQVVARMLELMTQFNLTFRQGQAQEETRFTAERLAEAQDRLHGAEQALQTFLERNRRFRDSPELTFEYERLQRQVMMRQEVYTMLSQSLERARIEAVRDIPVLTITSGPEGSALPRSRGTLLFAILGLFLGLMTAVAIAFIRDYFPDTSDQRLDHREFRKLADEFREDLRHPSRILRRGA